MEKSQSSNMKNILVVEDNMLNLELIVDLLEINGFNVYQSTSGSQALSMIKTLPLDLVLMDIQLPGMDGYTLVQEVRKFYDKATLPVIAVTAHAMKGDEEKILQYGFVAYISKPINTRTFIDEIRRHLK